MAPDGLRDLTQVCGNRPRKNHNPETALVGKVCAMEIGK